MTNSAPHDPPHDPRSSTSTSNVTYLHKRLRLVEASEPPPFRAVWTEELERRRRAVARWRGGDDAEGETKLRP